MPEKGAHPYAIMKMAQDIRNLGYREAIIKTDQEPAIINLKNKVMNELGMEMVPEESPVGESQSNGDIENTIRRVEGLVRTMKQGVEDRYNTIIGESHVILPWLVRHSGATLSRYQRGRDGLSGYRRLKGREFNRPIVELGECVWYMKVKDPKRGKSSPVGYGSVLGGPGGFQ